MNGGDGSEKEIVDWAYHFPAKRIVRRFETHTELEIVEQSTVYRLNIGCLRFDRNANRGIRRFTGRKSACDDLKVFPHRDLSACVDSCLKAIRFKIGEPGIHPFHYLCNMVDFRLECRNLLFCGMIRTSQSITMGLSVFGFTLCFFALRLKVANPFL